MFYYGLDLVETIEGRGTVPSLVLALIQRLPDTSLTTALASGGRDFFGWGLDRHMTADLYDAQLTQIRTTVSAAGAKPPKLEGYPRPNPEAVTPAEKKPTSVAELFTKFQVGNH